MKKHIFLAYALLLLFIFPLSAKKVIQIQITVQKSMLTEIIAQAGEIVHAQSPQSRVEEKKHLVLLIKESRLDKETRAKIAYAIAIILRTSPQTMQLSQEAYSFLTALLEVQQAQENIINVAQQIKTAVATASEQERKRVVDAALKQLQSVTQEAQKTIENARVRINNMMQLSEISLEGKIDALKNIIEKAHEIIVAADKQMRTKAQKEFTSLIQKLDKNIKDAIMPDLEAIQQTTDETVQKSQESYDRLLTMTQIMNQEVADMVAVVEKEREKIENADAGSFGRIRNFVASKVAALENLLQGVSYSVESMMSLTYIKKQSLLIDRINQLLDILSKSKDKNLKESAQWELKRLGELNGLAQQKELDESIKKIMLPLIEKINKGEDITSEDKSIFIIHTLPRFRQAKQLELLDAIKMDALRIIAAYRLASASSSEDLKRRRITTEDEKNEILTKMNDLYQKIKNTIEPDVHIILNTTIDTIKQSQEAFNRLEQAVNEQRPLSIRARDAINVQASNLFGVLPQSIKRFFVESPGITAVIAGGILGLLVQKTIIDPYRNWAYNYEILKSESYYFNGILKSLDEAAQEKPNGEMEDANKYNVIVGVLEGLGLGFAEGWEKNKNKGRIRPRRANE